MGTNSQSIKTDHEQEGKKNKENRSHLGIILKFAKTFSSLVLLISFPPHSIVICNSLGRSWVHSVTCSRSQS